MGVVTKMSARPFKLQLEDGDRKIGIVISSLKELEKESMDCGFITSSEKNEYKIDWNFLTYSYGSGVTTLEDGSIVDSEKYFDNLPDNTEDRKKISSPISRKTVRSHCKFFG